MPGAQVRNLSLDIPEGKIFGIGGLAGQGKTGIANGIMGIFPAKGTILKNGEPLPLNDPASVLKHGLAFVSEDRRSVGLQLNESIEMNIALTAIHIQHKFLKYIAGISIMDRRKIRKYALEMIELLDIRCSGPQQPVRRLSGGNQQKVCLARALALEPQILIVSEPTRGIDIGAKKLVLEFLMKMNREKGMTILVISSELGELKSICDEIAIVSNGNLEGILPPEADDVDFGLMLSGAYKKRIKGGEAHADQK
jgi:simple sugar transport system ATP-binding protein